MDNVKKKRKEYTYIISWVKIFFVKNFIQLFAYVRGNEQMDA